MENWLLSSEVLLKRDPKLNLFADDMTCFLSDKGSYITLFRLLEDFGECSGLKVNHEKTDALYLVTVLYGKMYLICTPFVML